MPTCSKANGVFPGLLIVFGMALTGLPLRAAPVQTPYGPIPDAGAMNWAS